MQDVSGSASGRLLKVSGAGDDRPGIVNEIAEIISTNGGNVILQRSTKIAGDFTITLVANFDLSNDRGFRAALLTLRPNALGDTFVVFAREVSIGDFAPSPEPGLTYVVKVSGPDRSGIIESMTLYLLRKNINLDVMDSEVTFDSDSGTLRFWSNFEITVPVDFDIGEIDQSLTQAGRRIDLAVDIDLKTLPEMA